MVLDSWQTKLARTRWAICKFLQEKKGQRDGARGWGKPTDCPKSKTIWVHQVALRNFHCRVSSNSIVLLTGFESWPFANSVCFLLTRDFQRTKECIYSVKCPFQRQARQYWSFGPFIHSHALRIKLRTVVDVLQQQKQNSSADFDAQCLSSTLLFAWKEFR